MYMHIYVYYMNMFEMYFKCAESKAQAAENLIVLTTSLAPGRFTRLWGILGQTCGTKM